MSPAAEAALTMPIGGAAEGPDLEGAKTDLSDTAPNGPRFAPREQKNLEPRESARGVSARRVPGPGEPGFRAVQQQSNLAPVERTGRKEPRRK